VEAFCVSCDKPTSPMIASGWSICRKCRAQPTYDFTALNKHVPSKKGRDFIKRAIRAHLPKEATA
jgi:hypothetical protein